jgi:ABC-type amino acid transport substrate-binding protein
MPNQYIESAKKLPPPVSTVAAVLGWALDTLGNAVTVSLLAGVVVGLFASGVLLWKGYYPLAGTLFVRLGDYGAAKSQINVQATQISELNDEVTKLRLSKVGDSDSSTGLIPMSPSGNDIIDNKGRVNFAWNDSKKDRSAYTIVVRQKLANDNQSPVMKEFGYNKIDGDNKWPVSLSAENMPFGEYVWTVKPTRVDFDSATSDDSETSDAIYRRFSVYPSVLAKISALHTLVVGTSLIPDQLFFAKDSGTGKVSGYEPQLLNLIAQRLSSPQSEITVKFHYLSWNDLLPELSNHEIDMVVSSMTKTKTREAAENVTFSTGYYTTHQRFVARRGTEQCLSGKSVGVLGGNPKTTNEIAAELLEPRFGFTNIKRYRTSLELFKGLESAEVDVILVDDISAERYYKENDPVEFFGPNLDETLTKLGFFDNIGFPQEEFGIAVSHESGDLLGVVNSVLDAAKKNGTLNNLSGGLVRGGLKRVSTKPLC